MLECSRRESGEGGAMVIRVAGERAVGRRGLEAWARGIGWIDNAARDHVGLGCFQACERGAQMKSWIGQHGGEWRDNGILLLGDVDCCLCLAKRVRMSRIRLNFDRDSITLNPFG